MAKKTLSPLGKELRKIAIDRELSAPEMAEALGISPFKLRRIEAGEVLIDPATVANIVGTFASDPVQVAQLRKAAYLSTPILVFSREDLSPEKWEELLNLHSDIQVQKTEGHAEANDQPKFEGMDEGGEELLALEETLAGLED